MRAFTTFTFILILAASLAGQTVAENDKRTSLTDLPPLAQYAISAAIGRDQAAYHVTSSADGLRAVNDAQSLTADFAADGITVRTPTARFGLRLDAVGRGDTLTLLADGERRASKNRVEYRRGELVEWYVNGPRGLQQGFTLDRAPDGDRSGAVTLALALSGDLEATIDADAHGATISQTLSRPGGCALRYTGLTAYDATGRTLDATLAMSGERLLIRVNDTGAEYPVVVDPIFEAANLTASDGAAGDRFGVSVSISGDTMVIGAFRDDDKGTESGSAYVFVKPTTGWAGNLTETAKLTASDGATYDQFGVFVSISGDTVVVGAHQGRPVSQPRANGKAYVFVKPAAGWSTMTETAKLTASDGAGDDHFGYSVAISGDTVIVGARWDDDGGANAGSAYVFVKPATGWAAMTETAKLTASDSGFNREFGVSVAISGDTALVGARYAGPKLRQGAAYVFVKPAAGWSTMTETAKLTASDCVALDEFGYSVSISGDTLAVGALNDIGSNANQGSAYVFVKPATGWATMTETAKLTASDGATDDFLGWSVAISGDTVVAGARAADIGSNANQGSAYVFVKPATGWAAMTETAKLTASDGATGDSFGWSVSIGGDTLVGGAYSDDDNGNGSGSAYVHCLATVTGSGSGKIGTAMNLALRAVCDGGQTYQVATSLGKGPIPIDTRTLSLSPDGVFFTSVSGLVPSVFLNYAGVLNAQGLGNAALNLPNIGALVGVNLHTAFITLNPQATSGVESISDPFSFRVTS